MSSTASLNSVIEDAIRNAQKELHTCTPGIIESFDVETKQAKIRPSIQRVLRDGRIVDLPKLIGCPLGLLRFGGFTITFPVSPGDECIIHFTERSLDAWKQLGDVRPPRDTRMHHESDAYFLPIHTSQREGVTNYDADKMVLRNEDNSLRMAFDTSGNLTVDAVNQITITAPETQINSNVTIEGTLEVTDDCDLGSDGNTTIKMNGGNATQILTTGSINPLTGTPYPVGNPNITGDA